MNRHLLISMWFGICSSVFALGPAELDTVLRVDLPEQQILAARQQVSEGQLAQRQGEAGWQIFAGANLSHQQDIPNPGTYQRYVGNGWHIGASHALLGTLANQQQSINESQLQLSINRLRGVLSQREQLRQLRQSWLDLWLAQQQLTLSQSMLIERNTAAKVLGERQQVGLVLKSDQLEAMSAFDGMDRLQAQASRQAESAQQQIARLSSLKSLPAQLSHPSLEIGAADTLPDSMQLLQIALDGQQQNKPSRWSGIDAEVSFGESIGFQSNAAGQNTNSTFVNFNLHLPAAIGNWRDGRKLEQQGRILEASAQLAIEQQKLLDQRTALRTEIDISRSNVIFQQTRLASAKALLREKNLRKASLKGDVYEQWLRAFSGWYSVQLDELASWKHLQSLLVEQAALEGRQLQNTINAPQTKMAIARKAVYLWQSAPLLTLPEKIVSQLSQAEITRVMVSFSASQIAQLTSLMPQIHTALSTLHSSHIQVDLLLGEPNWITPAGRGALLALIRKMSALPFDGLQLDLEVEQLKEWKTNPPQIEKQWLATLDAAASTSPWPLGISMHPRHMESSQVASRLPTLGVKQISLMIYNTNTALVLQQMKQAQQIWPGLQLDLAMSLERDQDSQTSYAGQTSRMEKDFININQQLEKKIGLAIQSWEDLKTAAP